MISMILWFLDFESELETYHSPRGYKGFNPEILPGSCLYLLGFFFFRKTFKPLVCLKFFFFFSTSRTHREEDSLCPLSPCSPPRLLFYPNLNLALAPPLDITAAASDADFRGRRPPSGPSQRDQNFHMNPSCLGSNKVWGDWRNPIAGTPKLVASVT